MSRLPVTVEVGVTTLPAQAAYVNQIEPNAFGLVWSNIAWNVVAG
ncbi:hypothetical protein AB0K15_45195 [Amycolatopsis sp. NPDC049253]